MAELVSGPELVALFEKASKAAEGALDGGTVLAAEEARCTEALKAMGGVEVSTALLMSTQVGRRLRKLTKHQSSLISSSAQQLLEAWKKVVADEAAVKSGTPNGTPKDVSPSTIKPETPARTPPSTVVKTEVRTEVKTEMKVYISKNSRAETKNISPSPKVESKNVKSVSPFPKVGTKNISPSPKVESKNVKSVSPFPKVETKNVPKLESKKVALSPKVEAKKVSSSLKVESKNVSCLPQFHNAGRISTSSAAPSSSANSSANAFEPKIGNLPKAGGDATRDKFREHLLEALKKCCNEVTGEDLENAKKVDFVKVVVAVEIALFSKLGLSKGTEKAKYRSIIFNLKDDKNPDFRRRVLLGEIKPEEIVSMTADDMASDARKKENEGIREKALFECERGLQNVASTDQFKCGKCHQRKTTYFQLQTRSADEPMTTFVQCVNCNNRWKFC